MKNKNSISLLVAASLFAALFITSCVKHEIVEPPIGGEIVTNIVANTTIGEIKAAHVAGTFDSIKLDKIIKATVIADDRPWLRDLEQTGERVQKLDPREFMTDLR